MDISTEENIIQAKKLSRESGLPGVFEKENVFSHVENFKFEYQL